VDAREPLPESDELPTPVRAALPRQFLLLFDLQFSPFVGVQRARATAARFVREGLAPGDLVAVATYGRLGFKMHGNFTTDHEHVARMVEGLGYDPAQAETTDALGLSGSFTSPAPADSDSGGSGLVDQEIEEEMAALTNAARQAYGRQFQDFVETLEDLAQALSRLSGRKQVILLSAGANESAWRGQAGGGATSPASFAELTARDAMARLFRSAGLHDVAIHAVNLGGIEGPIDVGSHTGQNAALRSGYDTLAAFAENTGGRFVLPTNDFGRALVEVEQASRRYYVLAFEPAEPGAMRDRPRSLKVRVRRDGLTLSHRTAYVPPPAAPPSDPSQLRLAAAEAIAKGLSGGPLGLALVAVPYREPGGASSVPAVLHLDGGTLVAGARGTRLDVEVYGYAMAGERVVDRLAVKTSVDLAKREASLRRDGLSVVTSFAAPPGGVDLRFFVRAGSESRTGSIRRLVAVPKAPAAGELAASPPLLVRPLGDRMAFPAQTQARRGVAPPFSLGGEILVPVAAPLAPGEEHDLLVFLWRPAGDAGRPLHATGEIARPGEAAIPLRVGGVRVGPGPDGVERCLVRVVPPESAPGDYALRLVLTDPETGQSARAEATLRLGR
jgi:VWFA-related protein